MRLVPVVIVSLLLVGCGNSTSGDQVLNSTTLPIPSTDPPGLVVTPQNAVTVATAADELFVPRGRDSVEVANGNLSQVAINGVAGALVELPLAYPILLQAPSGQFAGPGGGSATLAVEGTRVTLSFANFVSRDNALLQGTVVMTGDAQGTGQTIVTFSSFRSTEPTGSFQVDGPVTLIEQRTTQPDGFTEQITRTQNVTVTDLSNGGTVQIIGGSSDAQVKVSAGMETGSGSNRGTLLFTRYRGLDGQIVLVPDTPFGFNIVLATETPTITSGQSFLEGSGTIRRRVVAPNQIETAVRVTGASDFQVVGVSTESSGRGLLDRVMSKK